MPQKSSKKPFRRFLVVIAFFTIATVWVGGNIIDFEASVISSENVKPFDGMALPIKKVPNWVALQSDEVTFTYKGLDEDKWIALPKYDPEIMVTPFKELKWNDKEDQPILDAKITYTVPYMGNYKFDGYEHAGSHTGVDIKVPIGTPVYAIGNGVVTKVAFQDIGFGHHMVVRHDNFPDNDDDTKTSTYYSTYSHLDTILVAEGDVVTKGEQIATSGQTGAASNPHLHFQIDNDQAPWHPYWPFSSKDSADAGYTYTESVNHGLGQAKGELVTINPLLYIQAHLDKPPAPAEEAPLHGSAGVGVLSSKRSIKRSMLLKGNEEKETSMSKTGIFPDVESSQKELAEALVYLTKANIIQGYADGSFGGKNPLSRAEGLKLILQGTGMAKEIDTEKEGDITKAGTFLDVPRNAWFWQYVEVAYSNGIVQGYSDGTFKPDQPLTKVEFLTMLLNAQKVDMPTKIKGSNFRDIPRSAWYAPYVQYAEQRDLLTVTEQVFYPELSINREEAALILYRLLSAT